MFPFDKVNSIEVDKNLWNDENVLILFDILLVI